MTIIFIYFLPKYTKKNRKCNNISRMIRSIQPINGPAALFTSHHLHHPLLLPHHQLMQLLTRLVSLLGLALLGKRLLHPEYQTLSSISSRSCEKLFFVHCLFKRNTRLSLVVLNSRENSETVLQTWWTWTLGFNPGWNRSQKQNLVVVEKMLWNSEPGQEGMESFHYPATDYELKNK